MSTNYERARSETPNAEPVAHVGRPLDWGHAVDAAAARLEEAWVNPDATGYMASSGLAAEFAATLCAYGMVADACAHMHRMDDAAAEMSARPIKAAVPLRVLPFVAAK